MKTREIIETLTALCTSQQGSDTLLEVARPELSAEVKKVRQGLSTVEQAALNLSKAVNSKPLSSSEYYSSGAATVADRFSMTRDFAPALSPQQTRAFTARWV